MKLPEFPGQRAIAELFAALPRRPVNYRAGYAAKQVFAALQTAAPDALRALYHDVKPTKTAVRRWATSHHLTSAALVAVTQDIIRQLRLSAILREVALGDVPVRGIAAGGPIDFTWLSIA